MLWIRHASRLLRDVTSYARMNRAWGLLLVVLALGLLMLVGSATQSAVPVAIYTLL